MSKNSVIDFKKPEPFIDDPVTDILRKGARKLLAEALKAEIENFLSQYAELKDSRGRQRVTRNGYLPEREIQTGIGPVKVKVPRMRDRQPESKNEQICLSSSTLQPCLKRTKSMKELIPQLYLKGIFTGDFSEAGEIVKRWKTKMPCGSENLKIIQVK